MIFLDDIIYALQYSGGVSKYWSELTKGLINRKVPIKTIRPKNINNYFLGQNKDELNIQHSLIDDVFSNKVSQYLPVITNSKKNTGIFHSSYYRVPFNNKLLRVVTVHDFIYEHFRKGISRSIHHHQKRKAILTADHIICVSKTTENDLRFFFPTVKTPISVIYNGVDEIFFDYSKKQKIVTNTFPGEYFLWVGKRGGYKNFESFYEKWVKVDSIGLVSVGGEPMPIKKEVPVKSYGKWQIHFPSVSVDSLIELYRNAKALVYPSLYEGFGIPVAEAMASCCPVIIENTNIAKEVTKGFGIFVNFNENKDLNVAIDKLSSKKYIDNLTKDAYKVANNYKWTYTVDRTLDVYFKLLNNYQ